MVLRLTSAHVQNVRQHAVQEYPRECCGALLGTENEVGRSVSEVVPLDNIINKSEVPDALVPAELISDWSARDRYFVDPREQIRLEKEARNRELKILGFYHSHPDSPACPSKSDLHLAWPKYSYVIVSVNEGVAMEFISWQLDPERTGFIREAMEILEQ